MALTPDEIQKLQEQFNKLNEELSKLGATAFKEMPEDIDDVIKAIKLMSNEIYDLKNAFSSISQTFKNTIADFNSAGKLIGMISGSYNKLSSLSAELISLKHIIVIDETSYEINNLDIACLCFSISYIIIII